MMKKFLSKGVVTRLTGSVAVVFLAMGVLVSQQALAQITSTKHNLSPTGTGTNKFTPTAGGGEICVFCHTPHGADITAVVPLWNRVMAAPTTYTSYNNLGTSSLDGATAPVGSVSLACLSCHDGVQAMNTMINQPGSGGYTAAGAAWSGTWAGTNQTAGRITNVGTSYGNLGVDLRNDHPIGIQYGGGPTAGTVPAAPATYTNTLFKDQDYVSALSATLNGQSVWWVETGGNTTRSKTDMQLYTRTNSTSLTPAGAATAGVLTGAQPFVECASCHDPHSSTNATFLRITNTGSAVCLACHIK